jgi:hypothetical protein
MLHASPTSYFLKNVVFRDLSRCGSCRTDVSEEHIASIFRVLQTLAIANIFLVRWLLSLWRWRRYIPPKTGFLQKPHGDTSQETTFFIVTAAKTSNLTPPSWFNRPKHIQEGHGVRKLTIMTICLHSSPPEATLCNSGFPNMWYSVVTYRSTWQILLVASFRQKQEETFGNLCRGSQVYRCSLLFSIILLPSNGNQVSETSRGEIHKHRNRVHA